MQNSENNALQVNLQGRLFLLFYRATALQRGKSFPSCAWRMPLLHRDFSLTFARGFLGLTTFLRQILVKYIRLIFLPHFTATTYDLYHSRYDFLQVHFRHLILHMRLICNMIIDIHCDLCIRMFFAPLRSVLNGSPPDIQHPITYCQFKTGIQ